MFLLNYIALWPSFLLEIFSLFAWQPTALDFGVASRVDQRHLRSIFKRFGCCFFPFFSKFCKRLVSVLPSRPPSLATARTMLTRSTREPLHHPRHGEFLRHRPQGTSSSDGYCSTAITGLPSNSVSNCVPFYGQGIGMCGQASIRRQSRCRRGFLRWMVFFFTWDYDPRYCSPSSWVTALAYDDRIL